MPWPNDPDRCFRETKEDIEDAMILARRENLFGGVPDELLWSVIRGEKTFPEEMPLEEKEQTFIKHWSKEYAWDAPTQEGGKSQRLIDHEEGIERIRSMGSRAYPLSGFKPRGMFDFSPVGDTMG